MFCSLLLSDISIIIARIISCSGLQVIKDKQNLEPMAEIRLEKTSAVGHSKWAENGVVKVSTGTPCIVIMASGSCVKHSVGACAAGGSNTALQMHERFIWPNKVSV
jgi:hypothetical protein